MSIANPIAMSVGYAHQSARFALWCRRQGRRFPSAREFYGDLETGSWKQAWEHLNWAKRHKAENGA